MNSIDKQKWLALKKKNKVQEFLEDCIDHIKSCPEDPKKPYTCHVRWLMRKHFGSGK